MEVDGIILSRQGLERSRAQGLGLPQQGHVLWAAEGQAGKAGSPAGIGRRGSRPQMALPISLLPRPPTQWGNRHVVERRCLPGTGQPGRAQVPGRILVASPGADLCTRPSSASEASGAANRRHLCSRPRCRRRSRVVVRRSGHSISHSGLSGQRAQNPETPRTPHLRLCQVTLTPPRAAWPPSCPRDTRVRFPWPSCGHFRPPWTEGSRWHHARVSVLLDPALQPREQRDARGTAGRRGQSLGRKKASGRNWRHSESGVNRAGPGAWLLASSDWGRYRPAPRPL